eukprot:gene7786-7229_t
MAGAAKKTGPLWQFVTKSADNEAKNGEIFFTCKFCGYHKRGTHTTIYHHLSGEPKDGKTYGKCNVSGPDLPEDSESHKALRKAARKAIEDLNAKREKRKKDATAQRESQSKQRKLQNFKLAGAPAQAFSFRGVTNESFVEFTEKLQEHAIDQAFAGLPVDAKTQRRIDEAKRGLWKPPPRGKLSRP